MTLDNYLIATRELQKRQHAEKRKLDTEYALSNNSVSVGDLISDCTGTIRVDRISVDTFYHLSPECSYQGIIINKDGTDCKKKDNKRTVFKKQILKINGEEIDINKKYNR